MDRYFKKISFEQFKKDIKDDKKLYEEYNLPQRQTKYSAGYDFEVIEEFSLNPGESKKIPLGVKANFNNDEMLMIVIRSGIGFKHNIRMCNQVGIIDSDYYNNNANEGHLFIKLQNESDKVFIAKKGERICQGIFIKFLTVDNEDEITRKRTGGFGSTN